MEHLYTINPAETSGKIEAVKNLFESSGAAELTRQEIEKYTNKAFDVLDKIEIAEEKKIPLRQFGEMLMNRKV